MNKTRYLTFLNPQFSQCSLSRGFSEGDEEKEKEERGRDEHGGEA